MTMRIFLAAPLLLIAACGQSGPEGARLAVTVVGDADRPDSLARRLADEATLPTLIARDGAGQTVAGLASSWRFVDDGRSLILRLRPVKWSDGKPLESANVVAAFRRAATAREAVVAQSGLTGADAIAARRLPATRLGVMAPIARVVELRLDSASPLLLGWLAEPGLAVVRADATLADYKASGTPAQRVLKRTRMAASPEARPAEITITGNPDAAAAVAAFVAGKTDIVIGDGIEGLGQARTVARNDALRIDPLWGVYGYVANTLKGPLADAGVRRALAMAIDRPAVVAQFGIAAIAPVEGLLPPVLGGAAPAWQALDGDARLAEARRLVAAAGWTADRPLRLVLLLPPGREHRTIAEAVAADWARIGVLLAVSQVDAETHDRLLAKGDFELAVTESSLPVPDAAALLARWRCGVSAYCNREADTLLAEARGTAPATRPGVLAGAEAAMLEGPPMIPLFTPVRWALVGRQVDGWVPNRAASHPLPRLGIDRR